MRFESVLYVLTITLNPEKLIKTCCDVIYHSNNKQYYIITLHTREVFQCEKIVLKETTKFQQRLKLCFTI